MSTLILVFASALLFAITATPGARWVALKLGIIDQPAARKVHSTPIPRFGGVAMYGAVVIALLVFRERFGLNQLVADGNSPGSGTGSGSAGIAVDAATGRNSAVSVGTGESGIK